MLTVLSCRGSGFNSDTFGAHVLTGAKEFFNGGPPDQPILVHGYNNPEQIMVEDYTAFANGLGRDCMVYSWPGGSHPLDFPAAVDRASLAGALGLRDVFSMRHLRQCCDSVIAHSLGARVALTALRDGLFGVKHLILMGPAVDWNVFAPGGEFQNVPACCGSVHILYSNRDEVLKLAFPIGDWGGDCHALGLDGPRDPASVPSNVVLHDLSAAIATHGDYVTAPESIGLVRAILLS